MTILRRQLEARRLTYLDAFMAGVFCEAAFGPLKMLLG